MSSSWCDGSDGGSVEHKLSAEVKRCDGGGCGHDGAHTDSDTKLLYCWMFLFRMSEQGPRTRSKRGRSSFTHFSGPRATTVAARGLFISSAISPVGRNNIKS